MSPLIPTNSIWIVETRRQYEALEPLQPKLGYRQLALLENCDIRTLPTYETVFFLLASGHVGNTFFGEAIDEVLRVRKNGKTLVFAIDGNDRLNDSERARLALELRTTVRDSLANPPVYFVSSYYAELGHRYRQGRLTLEELRLDKSVLIPVEPEGWVTGKQIEAEHAEKLWPASGMDKLLILGQTLSADLEKLAIDVAKKNWLVIGPPGVGKSVLTALLRAETGHSGACLFTDAVPDGVDVNRYFDGLIVVLDPNSEQSLSFLEDVCSRHAGTDKVIVVNKVDTFMYWRKPRLALQTDMAKAIKQVTGEPVYFVSSLYWEQYRLYEAGKLTLQDLIDNPEIVLEDALHLPVSKAKNKSVLPELLEAQSGFVPLLRQWE